MAAPTTATATFVAGPVPSTISTPSGCDAVSIAASNEAVVNAHVTTLWTLQYKVNNPDDKLCAPSDYFTAVQLRQNPVFSPGTACPTGYEEKCRRVGASVRVPVDGAGSVSAWSVLQPDETAIACCLR